MCPVLAYPLARALTSVVPADPGVPDSFTTKIYLVIVINGAWFFMTRFSVDDCRGWKLRASENGAIPFAHNNQSGPRVPLHNIREGRLRDAFTDSHDYAVGGVVATSI